VDVITDFTTLDSIDVTTAGTTYINLDNAVVATKLAANSHYYLTGTYDIATGIFTANSAATSATTNVATLIVADAINDVIEAQTSVIILTGVVGSSLTSAIFV
jgi:kynureninase